MIYYVYAYLRSVDSKTAKAGTPYYIGKGKDGRAWDLTHLVSVPKDRSKIVFLEQNLTEIGALALERRYIRWYGRKDNNTGILRNMTDGGDGTSGKVVTKVTRQKLSEAGRGRIVTDVTKNKIGIAHTGLRKFTDKQKIEKSIKFSACKWYNNGIEQCFAPNPPNNSYERGRLPFNNVGSQIGASISREMRWWNNGQKQIFSKECPGQAFVLGRKLMNK